MHCSKLLALRHAIENASNTPVTDAMIVAMLEGRGGPTAQLRALFEDSSLQALARGAASVGTITMLTEIVIDTLLGSLLGCRRDGGGNRLVA